MTMGTWLIGLGLLCGMLIASQGAINGRLSGGLGGPLQAALVSFSVGWFALLALNLAFGNRLPSVSAMAGLPWWVWIGGLLGAVMVASSATAVPKIGVAAWVSAVIAGQLIAAVAYDHFGAFGQVIRQASPMRILGVVFLGLGVYLVRRF